MYSSTEEGKFVTKTFRNAISKRSRLILDPERNTTTVEFGKPLHPPVYIYVFMYDNL